MSVQVSSLTSRHKNVSVMIRERVRYQWCKQVAHLLTSLIATHSPPEVGCGPRAAGGARPATAVVAGPLHSAGSSPHHNTRVQCLAVPSTRRSCLIPYVSTRLLLYLATFPFSRPQLTCTLCFLKVLGLFVSCDFARKVVYKQCVPAV